MATSSAPPATAIRILEFGRILDQPRARDPEELTKIAASEQALVDTLYADRSRAIRDALQYTNKGDNIDPTTLCVLALASYRHLCSSRLTATVGELARSIGGEDPGAVLAARQAAAWLLFRRALVLTDGGSSVEVGHELLDWFGGGQGKGPLVPTQEELGRAWWKARRETESRKQKTTKIPSAKELAARIAESVIGLEPQVRTVAAHLVLHMHRAALIRSGEDAGSNSVLLLTGGSGVGKTWLLETSGRVCGLPFSSFSAVDATCEGYVGMDISDALKGVITSARGDLQQARFGVCFIDELDKKRSSDWEFGGRDIAGASVQQGLLRIVEGTEVQIGGRRNFDSQPVMLNTNGMFFAMAGAFVGLGKLLAERCGGGIGFGPEMSSAKQRHYLIDALQDYGLIPELTNRVSAFLTLPEPTLEHLEQIAVRSVIPSVNRLLACVGAGIEVTQPAVAAMAEHALETRTYARGVKSLVSRLVEDLVFNETKGVVRVDAAEVRVALEAAR